MSCERKKADEECINTVCEIASIVYLAKSIKYCYLVERKRKQIFVFSFFFDLLKVYLFHTA